MGILFQHLRRYLVCAQVIAIPASIPHNAATAAVLGVSFTGKDAEFSS